MPSLREWKLSRPGWGGATGALSAGCRHLRCSGATRHRWALQLAATGCRRGSLVPPLDWPCRTSDLSLRMLLFLPRSGEVDLVDWGVSNATLEVRGDGSSGALRRSAAGCRRRACRPGCPAAAPPRAAASQAAYPCGWPLLAAGSVHSHHSRGGCADERVCLTSCGTAAAPLEAPPTSFVLQQAAFGSLFCIICTSTHHSCTYHYGLKHAHAMRSA